MTEDKKEYDLKMQEYAQLLDIRADRIRVSNLIRTVNFFVYLLLYWRSLGQQEQFGRGGSNQLLFILSR